MATGLRMDTAISSIKRKLGKLNVSASEFRPELEKFAAKTLATCIQTTPVRAEALIIAAQRKQYAHRVNFIPSYHELSDPSLRVNTDTSDEWIYAGGKWYNSNWKLRDEVWAAYQTLSQEHERRMRTAETDFIDERKQARFLYQRSWWQVAQSLGLVFSVAAAIISSHTRRKPAREPVRAFGQWRGGGKVLSVVIQNPFLGVPTNSWMVTWKGNGKQILAQATAKHRGQFIKDCNDKVKRMAAAARRSNA